MTRQQMIQTLERGMSIARNNADGRIEGQIRISQEHYDALYYAAYNVKKALTQQAEEDACH